jgi:hypothetical protein
MPQETTYDTTKIIIFGILLLVIVAVIGFLIFKKISTPTDNSNTKNLFPYDGTINNQATGTTTGSGTIENPVTESGLTSTTADRLRLIANYSVTSIFSFIQNKTVNIPKFDDVRKLTVMVPTVVPTNYLRFNAKQNGFLVDAEVTKNIISINQKTDTIVPNSQEVWFSNGGNTATYRSWDTAHQTIATFIGSLPSNTPLSYCQVPFTKKLSQGSKRSEVKEFQKYINAKLSLNLVVDGSFGKKLLASIKPLQKLLNVTDTGIYDQPLIDAMNIDCTNLNIAQQQQRSGPQKLTGDFIDGGILRGDTSPDGTQLFFLKPSSDGGIIGIVTDSGGKNQKQIFSSPLTEWKPQWINSTTIAMTTLASSQADGYLYFLNPITGNFQKELGPLPGMTTLVSPDGSIALVGSSSKKNTVLATYSLTTGARTPLDLTTLPEKCVWQNNTVVFCAVPQGISDGQYPDDWYQGNIVFKDSLWSIDTSKGSTANIISPTQSFDISKLIISPDGSYLYFINKIDGTLWSYRLSDN